MRFVHLLLLLQAIGLAKLLVLRLGVMLNLTAL